MLEQIIREQGIVSIPSRPLVIRMASEAESAATPQPHLRTPRLVGNTGELIEFLMPMIAQPPPGEARPLDDHTYEAMAMFQDHAEKVTNTLVEQSAWIPDEGRRLVGRWTETCKKGREELKTAADDNFERLAEWVTTR